MKSSFRQHSVLPGFGITLGITIFYLSIIVLLPLGGLLLTTSTMGWEAFRDTILDPRVLASFRLTFGASLLAAVINAVFGSIVAWVLVRYRFPGKRVIDAMVDLPFALVEFVVLLSDAAVFRL